MRCAFPRYAWESLALNPSGKRSLVFDQRYGIKGSGRDVPCAKCLPCRMNASRDLAVRLYHEVQNSERACVATMTLDDDHLVDSIEDIWAMVPAVKERCRRRGINPRSFWLLEYGGRFGRPHAHTIWFHEDFRNGGMYAMNGTFYGSELMDEIWGKGFVHIDQISPAACRYVCGHNQGKLLVNPKRDDGSLAFHIVPAARPAVGMTFARTFSQDFISTNSAVVASSETSVPKAYLKYEPDLFASVVEHRKQFALDHAVDFDHTISTGVRAEQIAQRAVLEVKESRLWHGASHVKR